MTLRLLGKPITTAEMSTSAVAQRVKGPTGKNMVIRGVNVGLIIYNNPAITSLHARMYADDNGVPGQLIAQSTNSWLKAELHTLAHAFKNVGFSFDDIPLRAGGHVHIALGAVGYTGNSSSHIAWRNAYPDPQFTAGLNLDAAHADNHPLEVCLVGAEL